MADSNNGQSVPPGSSEGGDQESEGNELSLEQALLAPLNSILKAQLHSARSFLNLLLQLGYPHKDELDETHLHGEPYHIPFTHYDAEGNEHTLRVPALSLVPIAPLAIDSANFELEMAVKKVSKMQQLQAERREKIMAQAPTNVLRAPDPDTRPWFLVEKPVSIQGSIAPPTTVEGLQRNESQSSIKIKINVKSIPMPSGLDKLLTTLTNMGGFVATDENPESEDPDNGQTDTNSKPDDE